MPRRKIEFTQGAYYHIYNRGADRRSIFRCEENYIFVLQQMKRYTQSLDVTVVAYALLPNHYHWLVRQDGNTAAGLFPQRVFNAYVKAFNNTYGRTGTLFEDRYKAIIIESDEYLRNLCYYIHGNPVRHGIASEPGLWPFSNYLEWIEQRQGTLLDRQFVDAHFGSAERYRARLQSYLTGQTNLPDGIQTYLDGL